MNSLRQEKRVGQRLRNSLVQGVGVLLVMVCVGCGPRTTDAKIKPSMPQVVGGGRPADVPAESLEAQLYRVEAPVLVELDPVSGQLLDTSEDADRPEPWPSQLILPWSRLGPLFDVSLPVPERLFVTIADTNDDEHLELLVQAWGAVGDGGRFHRLGVVEVRGDELMLGQRLDQGTMAHDRTHRLLPTMFLGALDLGRDQNVEMLLLGGFDDGESISSRLHVYRLQPRLKEWMGLPHMELGVERDQDGDAREVLAFVDELRWSLWLLRRKGHGDRLQLTSEVLSFDNGQWLDVDAHTVLSMGVFTDEASAEALAEKVYEVLLREDQQPSVAIIELDPKRVAVVAGPFLSTPPSTLVDDLRVLSPQLKTWDDGDLSELLSGAAITP